MPSGNNRQFGRTSLSSKSTPKRLASYQCYVPSGKTRKQETDDLLRLQHGTEVHLALLQLVHGILDTRLRHGELLGDRRDAVEGGKREHVLVDLAGRNDGALDGNALGDERHVRHGKVAAADGKGVDGRAGVHDAHQLGPVGLRAGGHQQAVELVRHLERVLALGGEELVRAQPDRLILLAIAARQHDHAAAKVAGKLDGQVAKATDAKNTNGLGRSCVVGGQSRPDGGTSAHPATRLVRLLSFRSIGGGGDIQRGSGLVGELVRELEEESLPPDGVGSERALVQVCGGVHGTLGAVNLLASQALLAQTTAVVLVTPGARGVSTLLTRAERWR